ncbi:MAG: HNH endonuclease [Chloroflexi bacterium]|nr:HNH endonuclease [Chloroflexota bacterium]
MPFSPATKARLFIRCNRLCCLCGKQCGTNIEAAHIIPEAQGGTNDKSNAIPLCFDCHQEIGAYDSSHPRGNSFTPAELRARRDRVYKLVESGLLPVSVQWGDTRPIPAVPRRLSGALLDRLRAVALDVAMYEDVVGILGHASFPKMMSLSGERVFNPIWTDALWHTEQRVVATFRPDGPTPLRVMPLDVLLIKGEDRDGRPCLLTYFSSKPGSGWQAFLFPFRQREPNESQGARLSLDAEDIAAFLGLSHDSVSVSTLEDKYAAGVKPDFGYHDLVLYLFTFCSVALTSPPRWLSKQDAYFRLEHSERRFHWFHPEELEHDAAAMRVNADLIRAIHYLFATTIPGVPRSVPPRFLRE